VRLLVPSERRMAVTTAEKFPLAAYFKTLFSREPIWARECERRNGSVVVVDGMTHHIYGAGSMHRVGVDSLYELDLRSLALVAQTVFNSPTNAPSVEIEYRDHLVLPNGRIWPRRMTARRHGDPPDKSFTLAFDDIVFDAPLDAKKFVMRIPPGTEKVDSVEKLRRE
jgi:hypothetical protein